MKKVLDLLVTCGNLVNKESNMKEKEIKTILEKVGFIREAKKQQKLVDLETYMKKFSISENEILAEIDFFNEVYFEINRMFKTDWTYLESGMLFFTKNDALRERLFPNKESI